MSITNNQREITGFKFVFELDEKEWERLLNTQDAFPIQTDISGVRGGVGNPVKLNKYTVHVDHSLFTKSIKEDV